MHEEVVERRRWLDEDRFLHALSFCMLLPGPEAQQLATYIGWLLHGVRGGLVAGGLFVLPAAVLMLGLAWAYAALGELRVGDRRRRGDVGRRGRDRGGGARPDRRRAGCAAAAAVGDRGRPCSSRPA